MSEEKAKIINFGFAKRYVEEKVLTQTMNYLEGNPEKNIPRLTKIFEKMTPVQLHRQFISNIRNFYEENDAIRTYMNSLFTDIDRDVRNKFVTNFVINSLMLSSERRQQVQEEEQIHVPYTFLIDPTSACNLKCTGCWAGEYTKHDQLEPELFDRILTEAKELGIYAVVVSGGEPFVYPYLLDIAEKHNDMAFMIYTNGTKINEEVADRIKDLANISPAISLEGWEEETDARRGKGTFKKIIAAMERLRERGLFFGTSVTVTKDNLNVLTSDQFIDFLIEQGVKYMWAFHYVPIGRQPNPDLMLLPEQRAYLAERSAYLRINKPLPIIDFWNDGVYTEGCIAGGKCFFHINARGDVEPCAFVHFAVDNIRDKSLKEVLQNPLFTAYQKAQPFSENMLRPCPIIDEPDALRQIVKQTGAYPTHEGAETVLSGELANVLDQRAAAWKEVADPIWSSRGRP
ncbi:MAG: radical SAM protein [Syntrophaceticus sp.]